MASVLKPGVRSVMASSRVMRLEARGLSNRGRASRQWSGREATWKRSVIAAAAVGRAKGALAPCPRANPAGTLAPPLSLRRKLCPPYELLVPLARGAVGRLSRAAGRRRAVKRQIGRAHV